MRVNAVHCVQWRQAKWSGNGKPALRVISAPLGLLAPPLGEAPSPNAPGANSDTVSPDELGMLKAENG